MALIKHFRFSEKNIFLLIIIFLLTFSLIHFYFSFTGKTFFIQPTEQLRQEKANVSGKTFFLPEAENLPGYRNFEVFATNISECTNITSSGKYTLNTNLTETQSGRNICIDIQASDVILDCNGFSITGNNVAGTKGIFSNSNNNITIKNCIISNYEDGIEFIATQNSTFFNNTIFNNLDDGLDLDPLSNFANVSQNYFYNNSYGVVLTNVSNSIIYNNIFTHNINSSVALFNESTLNLVLNNSISYGLNGVGLWLVTHN
ncbi:MAG: right-handed parallel beta-helix repeat-containing protein, partial [Candidatus Nanoarchaeia archaeon]